MHDEKRMIWASAISVLLVFLSNMLWLIALQQLWLSDGISYVWWLAIAISGFAGAYIAPRKKILLAMALGIVSAVFACIAKTFHEALGNPVDLPGISGTWILFLITIPWHFAVCTLGGLVGWFFSKSRIVSSTASTGQFVRDRIDTR